ncbi:MAG: pirin-like C-terminal cupin domain-containing protein [Bacteroidota bacterium]
MNKVSKVIKAKPIDMGGIAMKQPLPAKDIEQIDPFLLIQHGSGTIPGGSDHRKLGVGPHPHRGFSPVTFIFKGSIHHRDSLGNSEVVTDGGTQWMHAGRGVTHSERPGKELAENGGESEIVQFWVNSPADHKMDIPSYQPIAKENTPVVIKGDTQIAVVSGEFEGIKGPANTLTPQTLLRLTICERDHFSFDIPEHFNCLIYLLDGFLDVNGQKVKAEEMIVFENDGKEIKISAHQHTRAMVLSGAPIQQSIAAYGPFVMNTQTEIMEALRDSQQGKMGILHEKF